MQNECPLTRFSVGLAYVLTAAAVLYAIAALVADKVLS